MQYPYLNFPGAHHSPHHQYPGFKGILQLCSSHNKSDMQRMGDLVVPSVWRCRLLPRPPNFSRTLMSLTIMLRTSGVIIQYQ